MKKLSMNKIMLITGTSKGIGRELAVYYLKKNWYVIGCSRGLSTIRHNKYFHHSIDIRDEKEVIGMVGDTVKKYDRIDVLLNNAGIASMNHLLLTPLETAKNIFNTNFFGTFISLREAAKVMIKNKFGRIINFSSVAVPLNLEGEAIYAASKAAVEMLTKIAAKELGSFGITVNAIGPVPVKTDLIRDISADKIKSLLKKQAITRFGRYKDIINLVNFFIDDNSDFVTGQVVYLGGIND